MLHNPKFEKQVRGTSQEYKEAYEKVDDILEDMFQALNKGVDKFCDLERQDEERTKDNSLIGAIINVRFKVNEAVGKLRESSKIAEELLKISKNRKLEEDGAGDKKTEVSNKGDKIKLFFVKVLEQEGYSLSKYDWLRGVILDSYLEERNIKTMEELKKFIKELKHSKSRVPLKEGELKGRQYAIFKGGTKTSIAMFCIGKKGIYSAEIDKQTKSKPVTPSDDNS